LLVRSILALVLYVSLGFHPVLASAVVVPDAFPAVQSAIDSGADTVLIRQGTYSERPVVDHAVVLQGIGIGQRPRLAGLEIVNSSFWATPPLLSVSRVDFSGPVDHTTIYYLPRLLDLSFTECSLDSGFYQVAYRDPDDVALLAIHNCRLGAHSSARVDQVFMSADTIDGSVSWNASDVLINGCWFRGGSGPAIALHNSTLRGATSYNRIEHYDTGISVEDIDETCTLEKNVIHECLVGMQLGPGYRIEVRDNEIQHCGTGIHAQSLGSMLLAGNRILGASGSGVVAIVDDFVADGNVVGNCGGAGLAVGWQYWEDVGVLRSNTILNNAGSGMALTPLPGQVVRVNNNIGSGNRGWGLFVPAGELVELGCNDWFGNGFGAVNGAAVDPTDLNVDPLFCNLDSADVTLQSASPLLGVSACGQIGALGVGCGMTATVVQRFTAERVSEGIRVVWEVAEGATASEVWLERSEGTDSESWSRPLTERSIENRAVVEVDRSAAPDRAYRYRLVAREAGLPTIIGSPIIVEAQAKLEFRLVQVGPNPGSGPVRIAFALQRAAAIEIDVFDVQGRKVASPGRGAWSAGTHVVEWDGLTRTGEVAPSGLYLLRYVYPGGQDQRRLARLR